jgi:hypothetical protein
MGASLSFFVTTDTGVTVNRLWAPLILSTIKLTFISQI